MLDERTGKGGMVGKGKIDKTMCILRKPRKCDEVSGTRKALSARCGPVLQSEYWRNGDINPDNKNKVRAK